MKHSVDIKTDPALLVSPKMIALLKVDHPDIVLLEDLVGWSRHDKTEKAKTDAYIAQRDSGP